MDEKRLSLPGRIEVRRSGNARYADGVIPYRSRSVDLGGWEEELAPGCFDACLSSGAEVKALWAHQDAEILGSRAAGTLTLDSRIDGLHFSVALPPSSGRWETLERGDAPGVSFGFRCLRDSMIGNVRSVIAAELLEISLGVAWAAYPAAQSATALRSLESREARTIEAARAALNLSSEPFDAEREVSVLAAAREEIPLDA